MPETRRRRLTLLPVLPLLALVCGGCAGAFGPPRLAGEWTWVAGSSSPNAPAVHGTRGVANPANTPGARAYFTRWIDREGNLLLFGGSSGKAPKSDLWKFDGKIWTWLKGGGPSETPRAEFGALGVPSPDNQPLGRVGAAGWMDSRGRPWFYGGFGVTREGGYGIFGDVWMFDGTDFVWMGGTQVPSQLPSASLQGVSSPGDSPGCRSRGAHWTGKDGKLWIFGGDVIGYLANDMWVFDGAAWTWLGGRFDCDAPGVYGEKGKPSPGNIPGARNPGATWVDEAGNLWLFGGRGLDEKGTYGNLNDLWVFSPATRMWTWVDGEKKANATGTSRYPGSRWYPFCAPGPEGTVRFFGGERQESDGFCRQLDDFWEFDGTRWKADRGDPGKGRPAVYGAKGTPGGRPGSRKGGAAWTGPSGEITLFGGEGIIDDEGNWGWFDDAWVFRPTGR